MATNKLKAITDWAAQPITKIEELENEKGKLETALASLASARDDIEKEPDAVKQTALEAEAKDVATKLGPEGWLNSARSLLEKAETEQGKDEPDVGVINGHLLNVDRGLALAGALSSANNEEEQRVIDDQVRVLRAAAQQIREDVKTLSKP